MYIYISNIYQIGCIFVYKKCKFIYNLYFICIEF